MDFVNSYLKECNEIIACLDRKEIASVLELLKNTRDKSGRIFFLGIGGSAANASHAVNDFRKIANIESYTPTDNVSEFSARANDEGWSSVFVEWLKSSKLKENDLLFILSVGGGDLEKNISPNIVKALQYAKEIKVGSCGIVGRKNGYTAQNADACIVVPELYPNHITPHVESIQSVLCHLLVSHPSLKKNATKW